MFGQARAHWTETRTSSTGSGKNRRTTTHTVHFEGKEVYLNSRTYLFGQHGGSAMDIQPGIHRYSFACQLPSEIPYSLDAAHGNIAYFVEAVLDIPWKFDKEIKTSFTVVRHDDLNIYQELKLGQALEKYKTFCCLFCESQPMLVQASIPCSGFAKGQSIPIKVQYTNKSDVDVLATHFKLYRGIYFTSQSPHTKTRSDVEVMVEKIDRGAKREQNVHIEAFLEIPSVLMNSNGRFCQTVKVEYYLQVEAVVDGCHSNPTLKFPITIGTVGFDSNYQVPQTEPYTAVPSAPFPQPDTPLIQPTAPMELAGPPNDLRKYQQNLSMQIKLRSIL